MTDERTGMDYLVLVERPEYSARSISPSTPAPAIPSAVPPELAS